MRTDEHRVHACQCGTIDCEHALHGTGDTDEERAHTTGHTERVLLLLREARTRHGAQESAGCERECAGVTAT